MACTALEAIDEGGDPDRFAAVEEELGASGEALFATRPTTLAGCRALVVFIIEDADEEDQQGIWLDGLQVLNEALARLAGQASKA